MSVSPDSPLATPTAEPAATPLRGALAAKRSRAPSARIAPTDGELLTLFVQKSDRAAFDRLVDRHAAMVWRVCRQALRRPEDAEDAFQATFLLLVRNARSIRSCDSAAGWLYRVAYRTAVRARKRLAARREESLAVDPEAPAEVAFPDLLRKQTTGVLMEELRRLPSQYQTAMVLRYLEGQSRRAIADQTDTTVAAVQGRLARGKRMLRRRLLRRGVSLSAAMGAVGLATRRSEAAEAAPAQLVAQTTTHSAALASGGSLAASAAVMSLYREGAQAMLLTFLAKPVAATAVCGMAALWLAAPMSNGTPSVDTAFAIDASVARPIAPADAPVETQMSVAAPGRAADRATPLTPSDPFADSPSAASIADANTDDPFADSADVGVTTDADGDDPFAIPPATSSKVAASQQTAAPQDVLDAIAETAPPGAPRAPAAASSPIFAGVYAAANEQVRDVLRRPLPPEGLHFDEEPLEVVLEFLRDEYRIDARLDRRSLDALGLGDDEPMSIGLRHCTLSVALEAMLEPIGLRAVPHHGVLTVVSDERANEMLEVGVYRVADLLATHPQMTSQLAETIQQMVEPASWGANGGDAEVSLLPTGTLVVSQTHRGHERVAALLDSLRAVSRGNGKPQHLAMAPWIAFGVDQVATAPPPRNAIAAFNVEPPVPSAPPAVLTPPQGAVNPQPIVLPPSAPSEPPSPSLSEMLQKQLEVLSPARDELNEAHGRLARGAEQQLKVAQAQLEAEWAQQEVRAAELDRKRKLAKDGLGTQLKVQQAEAELKKAEASLKKAEAEVAKAQTDLAAQRERVRTRAERLESEIERLRNALPKLPPPSSPPRAPTELDPFDSTQRLTPQTQPASSRHGKPKRFGGGGRTETLHKPSEHNPNGWATVADLKVGGSAPVLLPNDERPRPEIVVEALTPKSVTVYVEDRGHPEHHTTVEVAVGEANAGTIVVRGRPIEVVYKGPSERLGGPDQPGAGTEFAALVVRGQHDPERTATKPARHIEHHDGKADGKKSLGGSGHLIRFELPEGVTRVKSIRIHGSRYGTPKAPDEDFEIGFLSEDRSEILAVEHAPYGLFRRGDERWVTVRFDEPVALPPTFWLGLDFNPGRTKGVYVSYDTSTGGERSMTGRTQDEADSHKPVEFDGDWMVALIPERAKNQAAAITAPPSVNPFAALSLDKR